MTAMVALVTCLLAPVGAQDPEAVTRAFQARVADYVALRDRLAATLPALADAAEPGVVLERQRALGRLVQNARRGADPGDIFPEAVREHVRAIVRRHLRNPNIRAVVLEDTPGRVRLVVNAFYPRTASRSTVPVSLLADLPLLPAGLEYRFARRALVLIDADANLIVDWVWDALPR